MPTSLLHRGVDIQTGEFIIGFLILIDEKPAIICNSILTSKHQKDYTISKNDVYFIIPETLSVYSGLTDVDGNPIFSGDIVETFSISCVYRQQGNYPPPNVEVEEWKIERSVNEVNF